MKARDRVNHLLLGATASALLLTFSVRAGATAYNLYSSGDWGTAAWSPSGPPTTGDTVSTFADVTISDSRSAASVTLYSKLTILNGGSLDTALSASGDVTINAGGSFTGASLSENGSLLTLGNGVGLGSGTAVSGAILNIVVNGTDSASLAGTLTGSIFSKNGTGNLTLSNAVDYSIFNVSAGSLTLSDGVSFTSGINDNATVVFDQASNLTFSNGITGSGSVVKQGSNNLTLSSASYSGTTTVSAGTLTFTGGTSSLGDVANSSALVFNQASDSGLTGILSGTGTVTKQGAGNLTLSAANTYSGTTTVSAGTLTFSGDTSGLGGGIFDNAALVFDQVSDTSYSHVISGSGTVTKTGTGNLTLSAANTYTGTTTISGGTLTLSGALSGLGNITDNAALVFSQSISSSYAGNISGTGSVTKEGGGGLTLYGAVSYAGTTTINGGSLIFTTDTSGLGGNMVDNGTVSFQSAGSFSHVISGTGTVVKANTGTTTLSGANTYSGITSISSGTLAFTGDTSGLGGNITDSSALVFDQAADSSYSHVISGTGTVAKQGAGNLTLSGTNTYSGITTVSAGTLTFSGSTSSLGGDIVDNAALSFTSGSATSYTHVISGTGSLTKSGAGTLTLSGANTYTGTTTVNAGTLKAGASGSFVGNGAYVVNGGTLDLNNFSLTMSSLSGTGGTVSLGSAALTLDGSSTTTFAGGVTGTGSLTKQGAGTLILSGANTYTGTTTVSAGTLALGSGGSLASAGAVSVATGATFDISASGANQTIGDLFGAGAVALGARSLTEGTTGNTTFSGILSGTGGLSKQGSGTLTLSGANSYTGATTVSAGTLALGSGGSLASGDAVSVATGATFDISASGADQTVGDLFGAGSVVLGARSLTEGTASSTTFSGVLSGTGGLTKQGAATLTLSGANSYTGTTTVSAGTLEVAGSLASADVEVGSGATVRGVGTIGSGTGAVNVHSGGTLAAGSSATPGTLNVHSDLTFQSGSALSLRVTDATHYDSVHATGNVAIGTGSTLNLVLGSGLLGGDTLTLLKADGTLSGSFDTTNVTNNLNNALTFKTSTVQGTGGELDLAVTAIQGSYLPFATTPNQTALARVLNGVANDSREADLIRALNALPGTSLAAALTQISPVQQTTVSQTSLATSRAASGTLQSRMSSVRAGSTGLSMNQFNWLDQNIPAANLIAGVDLPTGIKAFQPAPDNRWGFFAAANGNFGDVDGQTVQSNYHGAGFTTGADYRIDTAFTTGFAVGYDYSKTDFDHSGSHNTANSVRVGPYATWKDRTGDWVAGTLGGAYHFYDSDRQSLGGMAHSSTGGLEFDTGLKYGHDFQLGQWTLTPTAGLDYLHLDIARYAETGSLAPLAIQAQTVESLRSNLGGTAAYAFRWRGIGWNPYVQAGWAHEMMDAAQSVNARFASGAGDVFTTGGDDLGRESATFGAGLQAELTQRITANLSYSGEANDRYQNHSFDAAMRLQF